MDWDGLEAGWQGRLLDVSPLAARVLTRLRGSVRAAMCAVRPDLDQPVLAGVSVGQIDQTIEDLVRRGLLSRNGGHLVKALGLSLVPARYHLLGPGGVGYAKDAWAALGVAADRTWTGVRSWARWTGRDGLRARPYAQVDGCISRVPNGGWMLRSWPAPARFGRPGT